MMNKDLKELYNSKWNDLCNTLKPIVEDEQYKVKPAYPLLIDIGRWENDIQNEGWYSDADIRVMIFGQETNGWKGDSDDFGTPPSAIFDPNISMGAVMGQYENFYQSHYLGDKFNFNANRYGTFHYGFTKFITFLNQKYQGRKISYIWNNIVKIGKSEGAGFPGNEIYSVEQGCFSVIPSEIKILKPHIVIFLTGTYDGKIKANFGEVTFSPISSFSDNEVAKVGLLGVDFAYRTYHPSAHLPKGMMDEYYSTIIRDIDL